MDPPNLSEKQRKKLNAKEDQAAQKVSVSSANKIKESGSELPVITDFQQIQTPSKKKRKSVSESKQKRRKKSHSIDSGDKGIKKK